MLPMRVEFQEDAPCVLCQKMVRVIYYATGVLVLDLEMRRDKDDEVMIVKHECDL